MNDYIANKLYSSLKPNSPLKATAAPSKIDDEKYLDIFEDVQSYVVNNKVSELSSALNSNDFDPLKDVVKNYIRKKYPEYLNNAQLFENLVSRLMDDMTGYGFLNNYFAQKDNIEEININSWDSIEVIYTNGDRVLLDEHFNSPSHAKEVILRILQQNNKHLDENTVYEVSYIGKAVRIATTIPPVADPETGVAASIRFIHSAVFDLNTLVNAEMLSRDGADALMTFLNHGVSICFCGSTGSGKTTLANALLESVPPETRVITLEGGTREFDLIERDDNNKVINNRLHLQTRPHKNQDLNVDLQALLDLVLKFDPEIVAVGEMVSEEAFVASETARTGHTVLTTIHANNAYDAYYRMFTLGIRKYELPEKIMLKFMVDAFPIVVFTKKYSDNVRRVQTILEGYFEDDQIKFNELYRYKIFENKKDQNGKTIINGAFEKVNPPSDRLKEILLNNGLDSETIESIAGSSDTPA